METKKTTPEAYILKKLVISKGIPMVKEQLAIYIKKLREGMNTTCVTILVLYVFATQRVQSGNGTTYSEHIKYY